MRVVGGAVPIAALVLLAASALASCAEQADHTSASPAKSAAAPERLEPPPLRPPPCPPELANCERASGTIAYVERVDPDGDGDAHFVLLSAESVTAPGLTIIDVRRDLRPDPLPGRGEQLAAAGPVFPGSRGQLQIEAVAVRASSP